MAMQVGSAGGDMDILIDINTTPLIDVMLVLLTMLIMTIPIQSHAVKLDMPKPQENAPKTDPVVVSLDIDFDGTILWNGTVVNSIDELKGYLASSALQNPQPEFHIKPHKLAKYDVVAKVMANAQRLGVKKMGFVGNEQYLLDDSQYLQ